MPRKITLVEVRRQREAEHKNIVVILDVVKREIRGRKEEKKRKLPYQRRLTMLVSTMFRMINSPHFICRLESLRTRTEEIPTENTGNASCETLIHALKKKKKKGYKKAVLQRFMVQLRSLMAPSTLRHDHSRKG